MSDSETDMHDARDVDHGDPHAFKRRLQRFILNILGELEHFEGPARAQLVHDAADLSRDIEWFEFRRPQGREFEGQLLHLRDATMKEVQRRIGTGSSTHLPSSSPRAERTAGGSFVPPSDHDRPIEPPSRAPPANADEGGPRFRIKLRASGAHDPQAAPSTPPIAAASDSTQDFPQSNARASGSARRQLILKCQPTDSPGQEESEEDMYEFEQSHDTRLSRKRKATPSLTNVKQKESKPSPKALKWWSDKKVSDSPVTPKVTPKVAKKVEKAEVPDSDPHDSDTQVETKSSAPPRMAQSKLHAVRQRDFANRRRQQFPNTPFNDCADNERFRQLIQSLHLAPRRLEYDVRIVEAEDMDQVEWLVYARRAHPDVDLEQLLTESVALFYPGWIRHKFAMMLIVYDEYLWEVTRNTKHRKLLHFPVPKLYWTSTEPGTHDAPAWVTGDAPVPPRDHDAPTPPELQPALLAAITKMNERSDVPLATEAEKAKIRREMERDGMSV